MVAIDQITECLDIFDLKYDVANETTIFIPFQKDEDFPYEIFITVKISDDGEVLSFVCRAPDYHPEGDLFAMANRHNCRCYAPTCYIDTDNIQIVMEMSFVLRYEVSPHFILTNVVDPGIYLPIGAFRDFELTDEQYAAR